LFVLAEGAGKRRETHRKEIPKGSKEQKRSRLHTFKMQKTFRNGSTVMTIKNIQKEENINEEE